MTDCSFIFVCVNCFCSYDIFLGEKASSFFVGWGGGVL